MLTARIVITMPAHVVCLRAYTSEATPGGTDVPTGRCAAPPGCGTFCPMNATIEIDGLRKRFGPVQALDGMTFTVGPGQVTGFAGPNGAGKSTTIRVVVGLDAPDAGTATIGGLPYHSLPNPLGRVGSLLDAGALHPSRSARNHLLWLAHSQGLSAKRVDAVIEQSGLESVVRRKAGGFSLGMRQRLGI